MCFLSAPAAPPMPTLAPPPPAPPPTAVDPEVRRARELARRAAARAGYASTIRTSGLGVPSPATTTAAAPRPSGIKALLGE